MVKVDSTAAKVRAELARRGKNQGDVAEVLGLTRQAVSRRLTGHVAFNVSELAAIANLLGLPAAELIGLDEAPQQQAASA